MAKLFKLEILTPEHVSFSGDVEMLTVKTTDGYFSFLADHSPVIMPVEVGKLSVKKPEGTQELFASEGFVEVDHEGAHVYVQACEKPEDINSKRAEEARLRAEERLSKEQSVSEYRQSKIALARAMARLSVASSRHESK